ncbi:HAMP domain-containing protein, partial [Variovorax sp. RHLX14]
MAIAATASVQAGMWVRYSHWSDKIDSQLPSGIVAELKEREAAPRTEENSKRLREIYSEYGDRFVAPSDSDDLLVQTLLSLAILPFVVAFGLLLARRIVQPVLDVATAAESVSEGRFSARAPVLDSAPAELQRLASHFNMMAERL